MALARVVAGQLKLELQLRSFLKPSCSSDLTQRSSLNSFNNMQQLRSRLLKPVLSSCSSDSSSSKSFSMRASRSSSGFARLLQDTKLSYGARIVADWLDARGFGYTATASTTGSMFIRTAVYLELPHGFTLSIQTHPNIARWAFAETGLQHESTGTRLVLCSALGCEECVIKHKTPDDLFALVEKMKKTLDGTKLVDGLLQSQDGEPIELTS